MRRLALDTGKLSERLWVSVAAMVYDESSIRAEFSELGPVGEFLCSHA